MLNINSEFVIDSCRESGEESVDDLGFGISDLLLHLLTPKFEFQNPKFLLVVRFLSSLHVRSSRQTYRSKKGDESWLT